MKNLITYVCEKLRINDDTKLINSSDYDTVITMITDICRIGLDIQQNKEFIDEITKWVENVGVTDFIGHIQVKADHNEMKKTMRYNILNRKGLLKFVEDDPNWIDLIKDNVKQQDLRAYYKSGNSAMNNISHRYIYVVNKILVYRFKTHDADTYITFKKV